MLQCVVCLELCEVEGCLLCLFRGCVYNKAVYKAGCVCVLSVCLYTRGEWVPLCASRYVLWAGEQTHEV